MSELPPHWAELLNRLSENGKLFIDLFKDKEERMKAITKELAAVATKVTAIQNTANSSRIVGAALGGIGLVGLAAALLTGTSSTGAGKLAMLAGGVAISGAAGSIITTNAAKAETEKISLQRVETLVKDFMAIIEVQKAVLEELRDVSEELNRRSSALITTTEEQAKRSLYRTERLQLLLKPIGELAGQSTELMNVTRTTLMSAMELLNFLMSLAQITPTHEQDQKLRKCIRDSASKCRKTVDQYTKMRNVLRDFEQMQPE